MSTPTPLLLIPGLLASPRLYREQLPDLWRFGPVTIADHTRDDSMAAIARRILADAPSKFALAGLSMGGYISFEILRQAPERVTKLALMDTTARPDTPEQTQLRRAQIISARSGRFAEIPDQLFAKLVHATRKDDEPLRNILRQMAEETTATGFVNQLTAIIGRPDSRPMLSTIACPTLVLVGDGDQLTPLDRAEELANGIPGAKLVVIPDSGHLSTIEQPQRVTAALVDWLSS